MTGLDKMCDFRDSLGSERGLDRKGRAWRLQPA